MEISFRYVALVIYKYRLSINKSYSAGDLNENVTTLKGPTYDEGKKRYEVEYVSVKTSGTEGITVIFPNIFL